MRTLHVWVILVTVLAVFATRASGDLTQDQCLQKLKEGNLRYATNGAIHPNMGLQRRAEVESKQQPFAVVLACADSRVSPEILFDQGLGDLFVVRVAGNVVDNPGLGSIEYAVEHLHASLVIVMGHQNCGAVKATLEGGHAPGHIHSLIRAIEPAIKATKGQPGDPLDNAIRENVQSVVKQLSRAEPILSGHKKAGKLQIVGARYDLHSGLVEFLP